MTSQLAADALADAAALRRHQNRVHSDHGSQSPLTPSSARCEAVVCADRRAESGPVPATPRRSRPSACRRRTSSTDNAGPPVVRIYGWRSPSGSRKPVTADAPRRPRPAHAYRVRDTSKPLARPERTYPSESTRLGTDPCALTIRALRMRPLGDRVEPGRCFT
jgi:hypothetical protein